ncbi:P-loop containing nucleoside triphosphate hydrolase protein, partial [Podospora aff. communis PSN243]
VRSELLIAVLPTGGGKSVFFMLPAVLDESSLCGGLINIVVVPFAALIRDMEKRAREMGVDCLWWRTGSHGDRAERQRDARLVLVSADVAVCLEFMAYVQSIRSRGRLGRIFFDECHTSITDVSYRARLGKLKEMHRFGCPMVMLTATLPVSMEMWYREKMLCRDAAILRSAAAKHNIRYRVRTVRKGEGSVQDAVLAEMRQLEGAMSGSQKGVVYTRSIAACELLGEAAGCGIHHSKASEDANQAALRAWTAGGDGDGARWIVATSGLGTGIDIAGITAIVHMQEPHGLVDFTQQTGRGGRRAGEVVESVIVTDGRPVRDDEFEDDISRQNRTAMRDFIQQKGCRRVGLGKFLDGAGLDCTEQLSGMRAGGCGRGGQQHPHEAGRRPAGRRGGHCRFAGMA